MLHHVELDVAGLERSCASWTPFMTLLGHGAQRGSGGMNGVRSRDETCFCRLPAPAGHRAAGYHRQRIGLNHLAFRAASRAQVDQVAGWVRASGHTLLYADRHPYAGGPGHCAAFLEDPDRFKLEVVAPDEG